VVAGIADRERAVHEHLRRAARAQPELDALVPRRLDDGERVRDHLAGRAQRRAEVDEAVHDGLGRERAPGDLADLALVALRDVEVPLRGEGDVETALALVVEGPDHRPRRDEAEAAQVSRALLEVPARPLEHREPVAREPQDLGVGRAVVEHVAVGVGDAREVGRLVLQVVELGERGDAARVAPSASERLRSGVEARPVRIGRGLRADGRRRGRARGRGGGDREREESGEAGARHVAGV